MKFRRLPQLSLTAALALALTGAAHAGDFSVPTGFNFETAVSAGPAYSQLPDGRILLSTGSFGADELSVLQPDGTGVLFATGFGSLAGVAQSPITGDIIVGDSFSSTALWVLRDLNNDGDMLDGGEMFPHAAQPFVLSDGLAPAPFGLAFKPGTDELYMSGSTFGSPALGIVTRSVGGVMTSYAENLGFAGGMAWDGDDLYVADLNSTTFRGRVITLTDGNADQDALDAGELVEFASDLSGAFGLVRAADGAFYLSGVFDEMGDFSSSIARLAPDGDNDGLTDEYIETYIDGFAFSGAMVLVEGSNGFIPGVDGDGLMFVPDFTFPFGNRVIRSAPRAATSVVGSVANNSAFNVVVSGDVGAAAFFVMSLDVSGLTVSGIGDLCVGFGAAHLISPIQIIGVSGSATTPVILHGLPGLVGLQLGIQGLVFEGGRVGIANGLEFTIGS